MHWEEVTTTACIHCPHTTNLNYRVLDICIISIVIETECVKCAIVKACYW